MKIVIDGFGGDNAPDEVLKGAALAVEGLGIDVAVTGDIAVLEERMNALKIDRKGIELVPAEGIITTEDNPRAILKEKSGTSMGVAFNMLARGEADAAISAGSTAAIVIGGTMIEKRIKGVKRTALVPLMPCKGGKRYCVLDGGANIECRPEMLQQFAIMGSCFMEKTMGVKNPRVGLLNIGTEDEKGRELEHEAKKLLDAMPDALCVVSGGQGDNETVPEAEAMRAWLEENGISPDRLIVEPDSHTTSENIRNTKELLDKLGLSDARIIGVSTAFHLPRIETLSRLYGLPMELCVRTP